MYKRQVEEEATVGEWTDFLLDGVLGAGEMDGKCARGDYQQDEE